MTAALKALNDLPAPYQRFAALAVILVTILGGGSYGIIDAKERFADLNRKLDMQTNLIREYQQKSIRNSWDISGLTGRVDGSATKNREQDNRIRTLELQIARMAPASDTGRFR